MLLKSLLKDMLPRLTTQLMEMILHNGILSCIKKIHAQHAKKKELLQLESTRKYVEWTFGVIQVWFAIVCRLAGLFDCQTLKEIIIACIILHNMSIEVERHSNLVSLNLILAQRHKIFFVTYRMVVHLFHERAGTTLTRSEVFVLIIFMYS